MITINSILFLIFHCFSSLTSADFTIISELQMQEHKLLLVPNFGWLLAYSHMSLTFLYSPLVVACGGKANMLCVNSQRENF